MASVAPDQILNVKQAISNYLSQSDMNTAIRDVLNDYTQRHPNSGPIDRDNLIRELQSQGVLDSMMNNLRFDQLTQTSPRKRQLLTTGSPTVNAVDTDQLLSLPLEQGNFNVNRRHLYLQFLTGKAFTGTAERRRDRR